MSNPTPTPTRVAASWALQPLSWGKLGVSGIRYFARPHLIDKSYWIARDSRTWIKARPRPEEDFLKTQVFRGLLFFTTPRLEFAKAEGDTVEFDRNRYFMIGVLLVLLGLQFRMIDSFVLNETSTRALAKIAKDSQVATQDFSTSLYMNVTPSPKKTVQLPRWLGWALLTAGGVMCLHAMVLPKPPN
jgi:hypothetical protein